MSNQYPKTWHTAGTTYSRAGLYTLPAGTWSAAATVKTGAGVLVQTLSVNLSALGTPDADGHTHALSILATAEQTASWPTAALMQDIIFTDASATPVKVPADSTIINCTAHTLPISEADNPLQVITPDMAPVLRGEQGPPGADSTVPGPTGPQGPAGATGAQGPAGQGVPAGGTTGQVLAKKTGADFDTEWVAQTGGSGGGATNLSYTASPTGGTVASDTGTDATLPLADGTNAGLMAPAQHTKLAGIAAGATAVTVDAAPTDGSANAVSSNGVFDALAGKSDTGHNHSGTYDPAGTAASAVSSHAVAADPHPGYALESALGSAAAASTTDFTPAAHAGAGGSAHANAVAGGAAGFMTGTDKTKLDGIAAGATAFDGAYSSLSGKPTLGDAAAKNVGTTAGTVAAGDDARFPSGTNTGDETGARVATLLHAASAKTTLVDADEVNGTDSAASWGLIRTTWANVWTYIKSKADAVYAAVSMQSRSVTILLPATNDEVTLFRAKAAMTITKMIAVGGGFTYTVRKAADRSATGTEVVTGGSAVTSTTTGDVVTSFNSATIAADDWVWVKLTSVTGTPASFNLTMEF